MTTETQKTSPPAARWEKANAKLHKARVEWQEADAERQKADAERQENRTKQKIIEAKEAHRA